VWDGWARTYIKSKDWEKAIGVYKQALERFPDEKGFQKNIKYCEQQMKKASGGAG
jgi:pentatricopeptide repeat protein